MVTHKSIFDFLFLGISIKVLKSGLDLVILKKSNDKKAHNYSFRIKTLYFNLKMLLSAVGFILRVSPL